MQPVSYEEIDGTAVQLITVGATEVLASDTRVAKPRRTFLSIVPITSSVTVTVILGNQTTYTLHKGTDLIQNQTFAQSMDENGKGVYQGPIWLIASGAGQVAMQELFDSEED